MKGILLAGGTGSRLWPITQSVSKQLLPVYDKPMIYYPLSTLMLSGVREIAVIVTSHSLDSFEALIGDGSHLGLQVTYITQDDPKGLADAYLLAEEYLQGQSSAMLLGDNLFHGPGLGSQLKTSIGSSGALIFGYQVSNPRDYGVVEFYDDGSVRSLEEKPKNPKSNVAVPGMYFLDASASERAKSIAPSDRGELEITDLLSSYLLDGQLGISLLPRGTVWLDTGNPEALAEATEYVRVVQKRQGQMVGSPEEIAWRLGYISSLDLEKMAIRLSKSSYGTYLLSLLGA